MRERWSLIPVNQALLAVQIRQSLEAVGLLEEKYHFKKIYSIF